ncbi:MAG: methyltransferase domain-containing protein [Planctomycetes bacterium]|nr:methyltransferase domain-containing protein [Planctomycetota bacterium]
MDANAYQQFLELERDHWWFRSRRTLYFDLLARAVAREPGSFAHVLDLGCGMGGMMEGLRRYGEPQGLEIEASGVRICRERGFHRAYVGSGYSLPHASASLDLVTAFDTIEHIEDDERALRECARALRPGGVFMATVPAYQFLYANNDRVAHHFRRYTRGELVAKARRAGFEVRKATYVNTLLFPLILPAVLALKCKERLFGRPGDDTTNLSFRLPRFVSASLEAIFSGERFPLRWVSFPCGHSLAMIAVKRG